MHFQTEKKDKYTIISTHVEKLDGSISPQLKSELVLINSGGEKNIIINLANTRYCDSSGLSAILVGNRLCRAANGTFVITGLQEPVKKLITISQLDTILNITPTLTEAIDLLLMDEITRGLEGEK